jgi:hypothetical protein
LEQKSLDGKIIKIFRTHELPEKMVKQLTWDEKSEEKTKEYVNKDGNRDQL